MYTLRQTETETQIFLNGKRTELFNWTQKESQSPAITCQDDGENKKQVHTCELPHVKLWTVGSHTYQSFHDTGDKKGVVTKSFHMHTHTRCHRKTGSYIYMCVKSSLFPIQKTVNFVVFAELWVKQTCFLQESNAQYHYHHLMHSCWF